MKTGLKKALSAAAASSLILGCTACSSGQKDSGEFTPQLDAEKSVTLEIAGFFGNFEALDQVENDFNELYPNVSFAYEQIGNSNIDEYLASNPGTDIFMTTDENVRFPSIEDKYAADYCADLTGLVDSGIILDDMLTICSVDGQLLRIPMSQNLNGIVVNVSLLEKEGLSVPQNYGEFKTVLAALKGKGYTPIQGPVDVVYSELVSPMMYNIIGHDEELQKALSEGGEYASEKLLPVFSEIYDIVSGGWSDYAVNETYPADNYDQAILRFFEGDVPFWVCNTKKFSGMRKRESKSEKFSAEPFEYQFMFAPTGENGVYEYREPWYGFSVNKDSDAIDYAKEFLRFLATEPELNKIAEIKGVPSFTKNSSDERYTAVRSVKNIEQSFTNTGAIKPHMTTYLVNTAKALANGEYSTPQEAADAFVALCSQVGSTD